ncbi:hypothetical protein [uncultured Marinobacter sp.]|uniref:hypothetical protein n=1 Tax=uncultured Marinobacter sp. TaxID=187379 RepID=UPI0025EA09AE|nr:hypothetical protein [uncultured Marinobacter sp.]
MTAITASVLRGATEGSSTHAASELDSYLRSVGNDAINHFRASFTNKSREEVLLEDIALTTSRCFKADWDGYGAAPISRNALTLAKRFVDYVITLPLPEVTPHPDGEIAFDWYGDSESVFSISFGDGRINYAGRFDKGSVVHGCESMDSLDFELVERMVRRIFQS